MNADTVFGGSKSPLRPGVTVLVTKLKLEVTDNKEANQPVYGIYNHVTISYL